MEIKNFVSTRELARRASEAIRDSAKTCAELQDLLSPIINDDSSISLQAIKGIQDLDRLQQRLEDLSTALFVSSENLQEYPVFYLRSLKSITKLSEVFSGISESAPPAPQSDGDMDFF